MALGRIKATAACLALALGGAALAHGPLHLTCARSRGGGVKVDGDISGWKDSRFVEVGHEAASFGEAASDDDASFRFALLWDARHLYLAVEVRDNSVVTAPTLSRLYEGDCVEVCFDVHNDSEGGYDAGDFQFVLAPTGPKRVPRANLYRNPFFKITDRSFVRLAANITTEGYVVEAAFPWEALGIEPKAGHVLGLCVDIRDYDADGSKKGLTWVQATDPAANPLRWADLILVSEPGEDVAAILEGLREQNARWQRLVEGTAKETDNQVAVGVAWLAEGRLSRGLGWNVQFRDGRFPDWGEAAWHVFLQLLGWTRPAWIRYGVNLGHWEPRNDDDDPSHVHWPGFDFRSKAMRHHYRVLDFCQSRGIEVLWANWCIGDRATGVAWLAESVARPQVVDTDDDPFNDAPYDPEEFAESLAACLYHLRAVRGYTCVRGISLWNEPDQAMFYSSPSADYPEAFWGYYDVLARHLGRLGIREDVRIVGPETSVSSYEVLPELARYLRRYSRQVDVLAHHDYLGYADYHRIDRGVPISRAAAAYAKLVSRRGRPVAVTEFGNMGNGAGEVGGREDVWAGTLSACRLVLAGLNRGVSGYLRWEFKPYGASWQSFGALTTLSREHLFEPYRPVFFPHALLCRAAPRGAQVLRTTVRGGRDENGVPRVAVAVLHHREAGQSILLVNDGHQPKTVSLAFDARIYPDGQATFGHLSYDASLAPTLQKHDDVAVEGGRARLTVQPRSVHALATWPGFKDLEPLPLLPPRQEPKYTTRRVDGGTVHTALMTFDARYNWHVWQSTSGHTTLEGEPERGKAENRVCRIAYDFQGTRRGERAEHVVAHTDLLVAGAPTRVSYWVRGDGKGQRLAILFLDAEGEVFENPQRQTLDSEEWQKVELAVEDFPEGWNHWSGDGEADYPLRGFGFVLTAPEDQPLRGRGIIEIDDVQVVSESR
ncbi:MAG: sugar-binding protein [Candidatus Brocadiia bacterium]